MPALRRSGSADGHADGLPTIGGSRPSRHRSAPTAARAGAAIRRQLGRRPWLRWVLVAALAIATAATALERADRVDRARAAWGATRSVWVATADVEAGDPLSVTARDVPLALVPRAALAVDGDPEAGVTTTDGFDPRGATARQRVAAGEIVTEHDVAARPGPLALVPEGWLAVPVVEHPASGAEVGDEVVVAADGLVLSETGVVVGHTTDATLIAVPAPDAPLIPAAADAGRVAVLLRP